MSHTNSTAHYNLPQYVGTDIINPLTDVNGAYEAIDTALYEQGQATSGVVTDITDVKTVLGSEALDTASQTVTGAINELKANDDSFDTRVISVETDVATLQTQMGTATTNIASLSTTVSGMQTDLAGKASQTALNTLTNKVGTGNLNTTAQNCVDAINEVLAEIPSGGSVAAEDVTFTPPTGGTLVATNVQDAIEEVYGAIPVISSSVEKQTGTLTAGQTSLVLTFTELTIGATSFVDWYVSDPNVSPTDIAVTASTITFTFEAQLSDITVGAKVEN